MQHQQNKQITPIPLITPPISTAERMLPHATAGSSQEMKTPTHLIPNTQPAPACVSVTNSIAPPSRVLVNFPYDVPDTSRSMFPPRPRNVPYSVTSFAVDVVASMDPHHVKKLGKSATLALFNRVLAQHAAHTQQVTTSTVASTSTSTSTSTTSSPASAPVTSNVSCYLNEHIYDIQRIRVVPSRDNTSRIFTFYVTTKTQDACRDMRHAINTQTTLTCRDATDPIVLGKVYPLPLDMSTSDMLSYIRSVIPSFTLTRAVHFPPSTHYKGFGYFSLSANHYYLLQNVFTLPGYNTPLTFERMETYNKTRVMCSLCFTQGHTRSRCPHILTSKRFCSNCRSDQHLAKQCKEPRRCLCCNEVNNHSIFDCE
jgi:hypothetical protein